jgi:hypothetical protein
MNRLLSLAALFLSLVALAWGVSAHLRAERLADDALRRREAELVDWLWPTMEPIYVDLLADSPEYSAEQPETLEELFTPLLVILEELGK